jgi:hypothetical protein
MSWNSPNWAFSSSSLTLPKLNAKSELLGIGPSHGIDTKPYYSFIPAGRSNFEGMRGTSESISLKLTDFNTFGTDSSSSSSLERSRNLPTRADHLGKHLGTEHPRCTETARKYNLGLCPDGGRCRFPHICLKCKKKGHRIGSCNDSAGEGAQGGSSQRK